MDRRQKGGGAPPGERLALQTAFSIAALDETGVVHGIPGSYSLDLLAQRWHIDPERLEELSAETIERGLAFMTLEAVKVTRDG